MTARAHPFAVCALHPSRDGRIDSRRYPSQDAAADAATRLAAKHGRPFCVLAVASIVHPPTDDGDLFSTQPGNIA